MESELFGLWKISVLPDSQSLEKQRWGHYLWLRLSRKMLKCSTGRLKTISKANKCISHESLERTCVCLKTKGRMGCTFRSARMFPQPSGNMRRKARLYNYMPSEVLASGRNKNSWTLPNSSVCLGLGSRHWSSSLSHFISFVCSLCRVCTSTIAVHVRTQTHLWNAVGFSLCQLRRLMNTKNARVAIKPRSTVWLAVLY